jgi:hypothetical protein
MFHQNELGRVICPILGVDAYCDSPCVQFQYTTLKTTNNSVFILLGKIKLNIFQINIYLVHTYHPEFLDIPDNWHPKMGTPMFSLLH